MSGGAPSVQQMTGRPGPTVVVGKKVYRLGFNTQDAKGRLEELVRSQKTREAVREKRRLGGQDGEDYFADFVALCDRNHYATLGPGWKAVLATPEGTVLFLLSLLQEYHPDMAAGEALELLRSEPEQCEQALRVIAPNFFRAIAVQVAMQRGAKPGPELDAAVADIVREVERGFSTPEPATD